MRLLHACACVLIVAGTVASANAAQLAASGVQMKYCNHRQACGISSDPGSPTDGSVDDNPYDGTGCFCRGLDDARACFKGECNREIPGHLHPADYEPELGGDGDPNFARCAFFETIDSRVDDRSCEEKDTLERSEELDYFTDPPRRVYTEAVMTKLQSIEHPADAQTEADRKFVIAKLLASAAAAQQDEALAAQQADIEAQAQTDQA